MAKTIYTFSKMQSDIYTFISRIRTSSDPYYDIFYLLVTYGFRFNEIKNIQNWNFSDPDILKIKLSKGQGIREISVNHDKYLLYLNIYNSSVKFSFVNQTTACNIMDRLYPTQIYLDSGKNLKTHLFRHFYIKLLSNAGNTPAEIGNIIGEININNVNGYINSVIYYDQY